MLWTIAMTVFATLLLTTLALNFKTPEKKLERRIGHQFGVADAQFQREMSVMLGPSIVGGNRIRALQNGSEIFPAMLEAIRGARTSVTFETFIYWSGDIGREFSEALSVRARAGVPVHVTIDWVGSAKMDRTLLDGMVAAGVVVQRYRPVRWYTLGRLNNRTHRKLLVVDGTIGFTGGVGIADLWRGDGDSPDHWRDVHFRLDGPVVAHLQAAFNDNWIKMTGEVLHGADYFPPLESAGDVGAHVFLASPASGSESMHLMFLMAISAAERSIDIAASYFVPDDLLSEALVAARRRGVRVRILLPGPHSDSASVRVASRRAWGPLLRAGAEVHLFQPTMLHAKVLLVDLLFVSVGSTNFDIRSIRLNDEASLNIYDVPFAKQLTAVFEADLRRAEPYTLAMWESRPFGERFAEVVVLPIKSQL